MHATNNKISLILTTLTTTALVVFLIVAKASLVTILFASTLMFGAFYAIVRILLFLLLFQSLEKLWRNIRSMRKAKIVQGPFESNFNPEWIDTELKLLLKEKAKEIGKLKEVEQFRKDFLGSVAHELRTPVFGIQGYLHTLLDGAIDDEKMRKRFVEKAAKNADGLTAVIEDLITISRIETNEVSIVKSTFDLIELIDDVFDSLEYLGEQKKIVFKRKGLNKANVEADYFKIKQVFTNLIGNSIKYGKENGLTTVSVFDLKDSYLIEVADNGIGIEKNDLPRIFERFFRVDKSRSRHVGVSTGLGLSIVKHFLEAHEQEINVRSSLGNGTIFTFSLPKSISNEKQLKLKIT